MASPVWFYVPNLIGYIRIITGLLGAGTLRCIPTSWALLPYPSSPIAAFSVAYYPEQWLTFFLLYFVSYSLDGESLPL